MTARHIMIAGGSGFLGIALAQHFTRLDWPVTVLTRSEPCQRTGVKHVQWDGQTVGDWAQELEGAQAVINLAGRSVDCRYHARNRRLIMDSRVESTHVLGEAICNCKQPPKVWLNSSTATIYKHTFGPAWDETGETGATPEARDAFSIEVAQAWESVLQESHTPLTRKIAMRTAMVLGHGHNSVFPVLCRLARMGLGGRMGSGRQFVSWIHELDFCRAVARIIDHEALEGPVNLAAPNPLPNAEVMRLFRGLVHMPVGLPAKRWMLEMAPFCCEQRRN